MQCACRTYNTPSSSTDLYEPLQIANYAYHQPYNRSTTTTLASEWQHLRRPLRSLEQGRG